MKFRAWLGLGALLALVQPALVFAAVLQQADSVSLPGDEVEIRLTFDQAPPNPSTYHIEKPARLVFDFAGAHSELSGKYFNLGNGNARSMTVVESKDRTRLILSMGEVTGFSTKTKGNQLFITVGKNEVSDASQAPAVNMAAAPAAPGVMAIDNIDFRRGDQGDGQIMIDLSQPSVSVDVQQQGNKIIARFAGTKLPDRLRRRLDVTDFATPVKDIDSYADGGNVTMVIQPQGEFEYLAYQTDKRMTISVKPLTKDSKRKKDFSYTGEKLSLNFQDIEVRTVLQLIADFTSMNLVASDTVGGKITLRLQNVPWDQALDLILKTKGLDKRTVGNVMLVAPADEIAAREKLELDNTNQAEALAPLHTEFVQINYAKANDLLSLVGGAGGGKTRLLSARGSASVDTRTNTLILVDTAKSIEQIRDVIAKLDVPVRQVMIESRIVLATTSFDKELGVNWNFAHDSAPFGSSTGNRYAVSGTEAGLNDIRTSSLSTNAQGQLVRTYQFNSTDTQLVDLGIAKTGMSSIAVGLASIDNVVLDLQLSALQSEGHGEVVATPKVMTADKQKARISSGVQIPYQQATSSGATSITFQNAELSLEVTPSITPDGRISMDLAVNNDSIGQQLADGSVTINTNRVTTSVVVDDGQTVVLGGIFKDTRVKTITKTPLLGDIPYLGALFRQDINTEDKDELLIFVTPRLVNDAVASK